MTISIIGTGYVGLVTGTCFAEMGNTVYCVDIDAKKIENLKKGIIPIYEPGLADMLSRNQEENRIYFTTEIKEAIKHSSICFIAVGTPMDKDGSADLQYVLQVSHEIGEFMMHDMLVVDKSTVPVGTADKVFDAINTELKKRNVEYNCKIVSNPEFLKEGSAIVDCMSPDRVVIGVPDEEAAEIMKELYDPFIRNSDRFIVMDVKSAEMTKYASNAMLATRISFMNEIAGICETVGANVNKVRLGMGSDSRIGYNFLYAGCGYGGSCFPKDVQALIKTAKDHGCTCDILEKVEEVNHRQKHILINKIISRFGENLTGKTFALWGLAFKPNTDDMREATSLIIIEELLKRGAVIRAYDPKAMDETKKHLGDNLKDVTLTSNKYDALNGADAMVLITEWKEFRSPDFAEIKHRLKSPVIFDGRNQYKSKTLLKQGFRYFQIGVGISK